MDKADSMQKQMSHFSREMESQERIKKKCERSKALRIEAPEEKKSLNMMVSQQKPLKLKSKENKD